MLIKNIKFSSNCICKLLRTGNTCKVERNLQIKNLLAVVVLSKNTFLYIRPCTKNIYIYTQLNINYIIILHLAKVLPMRIFIVVSQNISILVVSLCPDGQSRRSAQQVFPYMPPPQHHTYVYTIVRIG